MSTEKDLGLVCDGLGLGGFNRPGLGQADPNRTLGPNSKTDSIVALASDAIRYVDQKK